MAYEEYQDYEEFKKAFGSASSIEIVTKAGHAIDNLIDWDLENLIHLLYGKFAHLPEGKTRGMAIGRTEILRRGVKRAIQTKFYKEIYGHPPAQSVFDRDAEAIMALNLQDNPYVPPPKEIKTPPPSVKEKVVKEKPPRAVKVKSEFAQKVSEMTLEDLIKWALELGVEQEKIDKHKAKPLGLAKMNISNLVRGKLPHE